MIVGILLFDNYLQQRQW